MDRIGSLAAEHAVRGPRRGARELLGCARHDAHVDLGEPEYLRREVEPRALAGARDVVDSVRLARRQLYESAREMAHERRAADLVVDHSQLLARAGEPQHRVDEV